MVPPLGVYKINTDVALNIQDKMVGLGGVIRDSQGRVLLSFCRNFQTCFAPQTAEALAVLEGIRLARIGGFLPTVLVSDALSVVQNIRNMMPLSSEVGLVIDDILGLCRDINLSSFIYVPRLTNMVAHGLAKLALSLRDKVV